MDGSSQLAASMSCTQNKFYSPEILKQIEELNQEKANLVQEGRYIEAEKVKRQIEEMKINSEDQKKRDLVSHHYEELKQLEKSYNKEILDFHNQWVERMNNFKEKGRNEEILLQQSHQKECEELLVYFESNLPKSFKHSSAYLNLKQIEAGLVRQERFIEAHQVRDKADKIAKEEEERFHKQRNETIKRKFDLLIKKQNLERQKLEEKIDNEVELEEKLKETELEKIVLKYKNKKLELDHQQKQEKNLNDNVNLMRASKISIEFV